MMRSLSFILLGLILLSCQEREPLPKVNETFQEAKRLCALGKDSRAKELLNTILKIDPDHVGAARCLVRVMLAEESYDEALAGLLELLERDPDNPLNNLLLLRCCRLSNCSNPYIYLDKALYSLEIYRWALEEGALLLYASGATKKAASYREYARITGSLP